MSKWTQCKKLIRSEHGQRENECRYPHVPSLGASGRRKQIQMKAISPGTVKNCTGRIEVVLNLSRNTPEGLK